MDNSDLIEKLKASRKLEVKVGHITFSGTCPRYSRLVKLFATIKNDSVDAAMAEISIDGWSGVTEADVINGGDVNVIVPFSLDLYQELILDRKDWWQPISEAIVRSAEGRQIIKEEEIKNSEAGTTPKP